MGHKVGYTKIGWSIHVNTKSTESPVPNWPLEFRSVAIEDLFPDNDPSDAQESQVQPLERLMGSWGMAGMDQDLGKCEGSWASSNKTTYYNLLQVLNSKLYRIDGEN